MLPQVDVVEEELIQAHLVELLRVIVVVRIIQILQIMVGEMMVVTVVHQEVAVVVVLALPVLLETMLTVEQDYHSVLGVYQPLMLVVVLELLVVLADLVEEVTPILPSIILVVV